MAAHARTSDLMIELMRRAGERLATFTEETGEPLDLVRCGSLKVARRPADAALLHEDLERARRHGLDVDLISTAAAHDRQPLLHGDGVEAVLWIGDDLYFDPAPVARGYARAAADRGARVRPHTAVTGVVVERGRVSAVETDGGTIATRVVVDAAGAWARHVGKAGGIDVPLVPLRHQLFVTEPHPDADRHRPMVRLMDAAVYVRPCDGGLLWGVFEDDPLAVDVGSLDPDFDMGALGLDADVLWRAAADVARQLPILRELPVREHRGGLPTMTPDGRHLVGPVPGVEGFHLATGCNVAGLSISPAIGEELAAWIVDGAPTRDLSSLSPGRFAAASPPADALVRDAVWQYRHFYGSA
jgi:4-methylaminobutanoate oxidase (formaldehyde-forming)